MKSPWAIPEDPRMSEPPSTPIEGQTSLDDYLCTRDENCKADVTEHHPECPVEKQLLDLYGF